MRACALVAGNEMYALSEAGSLARSLSLRGGSSRPGRRHTRASRSQNDLLTPCDDGRTEIIPSICRLCLEGKGYRTRARSDLPCGDRHIRWSDQQTVHDHRL
jgi:hypothetical protein